MKRIVVLIGAALLVMLVGIAQADVLLDPLDPSDIHVNGGTAFLFGSDLHALTNPSTISLVGNHHGVTISDVILVFAIPGESESLATTANGVSGANRGDLTAGHDVYKDVLGLGAFHPDSSENFTNFTSFSSGLPAVDKNATNFDIWTFDHVNSSPLSNSNSVLVSFLNGPAVGTYAFAYGFGSDGKLYVTPFTETGLQLPPPRVPEPGMLMLFGSGLVGIGLFYRRSHKK